MNKNKGIEKTLTKCFLNWYLAVGIKFNTLTKKQAIKIARVRESVFNDWLNGKKSAPTSTVELIKLHAYGQFKTPRKTKHLDNLYLKLLTAHIDSSTVENHFAWKRNVLDELNILSLKRVLNNLKIHNGVK